MKGRDSNLPYSRFLGLKVEFPYTCLSLSCRKLPTPCSVTRFHRSSHLRGRANLLQVPTWNSACTAGPQFLRTAATHRATAHSAQAQCFSFFSLRPSRGLLARNRGCACALQQSGCAGGIRIQQSASVGRRREGRGRDRARAQWRAATSRFSRSSPFARAPPWLCAWCGGNSENPGS